MVPLVVKSGSVSCVVHFICKLIWSHCLVEHDLDKTVFIFPPF